MIDHGLVRRVRRSVFDRAHPDLLAPSDNQEFVAAA